MSDRGDVREKKQRWLQLGVAGLGAVGIAVLLLGVLRTPDSNAPAEIINAQKRSNFTLYYPEHLPTGFTCNTGSVAVGGGAVVYGCTYDNDKKVSISVQPRDSKFTTDQFRPTSEFTARIGRVYLVDLEDRTAAAVVSKDSWLLINAPQTMAVEDMKQFIDSLRSVL